MKYLVIQRTTSHTSGHEAEDLQKLLNDHAGSGWRLKQILMQTERHQLIIFEKD